MPNSKSNIPSDHPALAFTHVLYWQNSRSGLLLAKPETALQVSAIHKAIESSKTWGQFRKALPADALMEVEEMMSEEDACADTDPFDSDQLPGFSDGDWPTWICQSILDELPSEIIAEFGEVQDSTLNGPFLQLNASIDVIAPRLVSLGWTVECYNDLQFEAS